MGPYLVPSGRQGSRRSQAPLDSESADEVAFLLGLRNASRLRARPGLRSSRSAEPVTIRRMTKLMPGVRREDLVPADDPGEGLRIAGEAARQLKTVYGGRLRQVVLFGSWVRGEAHEESDVDLIVVLDQIGNRARERDQLVDVLYDLEVASRRAIQAFPVAEADAQNGERPFVAAGLRDGIPLLGSKC